MLATNESVVRESYSNRQAHVTERAIPSSRPQQKPHVSVWNRVSAFGCIGICTAILWFIAGIGARIELVNQAIYHMQVEMQTVSAKNASLTAQVDNLSRPTRILNLAVNQFHMHYANPIVIATGNQ